MFWNIILFFVSLFLIVTGTALSNKAIEEIKQLSFLALPSIGLGIILFFISLII